MALAEFESMVTMLRDRMIHVEVIDDTENPQKPDALFPNNWVSFHQDGSVITYAMYSELRRQERREDILDYLVLNQLHKYVSSILLIQVLSILWLLILSVMKR